MEEIKKLKVNLTDPYEWEGKITDPEEAEKLAEVCKKYNINPDNIPKTEVCEDTSEKSEQAYIKEAFSPQPTDVPGGEQYEEKKKKAR
ncbi:unnamed protein product [Heligmosomoides polygyrus]|uniref:Phage protein n=1 Tax=Heligmosomoides polygyrus TaxID=6339 RepID=A0A183GH69_HELPZ|nr:unnamed protein product [Heligmosomoides polygyrus]